MVIDSKNSKTSDLVRIHVNREDQTKTKREIKKSITNGKRNENTDMQKKVNTCATNEEDTLKVVQDF